MIREEFAQRVGWRRVMWVIGIVNPFIMAPQLWKLWATYETAGVSLGTLVTIVAIQAGFALHGFFLRDRVLILSNSAAALVSLSTLCSYLYLSA